MPAPVFKFSQTFSSAIWNTLAVAQSNILVIETRDDQNFQTKFAALDFSSGEFIWKDLMLDERWWIGLTAADEKTILFHTYVNKNNPDHKNLIAYDIFEKKIRWEVKEFSFFDWNESVIWGYKTEVDLRPVTVSAETGIVTEGDWSLSKVEDESELIKPVRYLEGTTHFETIQKFIAQTTPYAITGGVEYLEWQEWVVVSLYTNENGKLANYLIVFDTNGQLLMKEKLGENLAGLGTDTFFMLSGCLFLVKNRSELVVYRYD